MNMRALLLMALAPLVTSCTHVVSVTEAKRGTTSTAKVKGIPFYVKTGKFRRTTVYDQTWLRATLVVEKSTYKIEKEKKVEVAKGKQVFQQDMKKDQISGLNELKTRILNADAENVSAALAIIESFTKLERVTNYEGLPITPVKNAVEPVWVVDSTKTYYLNAPLPWFGSGSLTQKLNADGTLAEATSTSDTKIAEGLSTLIPFKEYLSGRFVTTKEEAKTSSAETSAFKSFSDSAIDLSKFPALVVPDEVACTLSISIEEVGYEYTLWQDHSDDAKLPAMVQFGDPGGNFSRKSIGGDEKKEKDDDGLNVGISGAIHFPKEWGGKEAEAKKP